MCICPPATVSDLLARAQSLAGKTLYQLAELLAWEVPSDLRSNKGWIGQLLEACLGANAGSQPMPDFQHLGIELKTIPVSMRQKPTESTYVCMANIHDVMGVVWEASLVKRKLSQVLWIPIEMDPRLVLAERRVGMPLLWQPSLTDEMILRRDWEEIVEAIALGRLEQISARQGVYLQIRPKAANGKSLCTAIGPNGEPIKTLPRGFYLRASFTAKILRGYL